MAPQHEPSPNCPSAGRITTNLLLSFLALASSTAAGFDKPAVLQDVVNSDGYLVVGPGPVYPTPGQTSHEGTHRFTLRNIFHHGTYLYPSLHRRKDVSGIDTSSWRRWEDGITTMTDSAPLVARSMSTKIERLVDRRPSVVDPMVAAAREQGVVWTLSPSAWTVDDVSGPNITDKDTVITFARMAADAYIQVPGTEDWEDVHDGSVFDSDSDFGWQGDGLRGHVFADENNSTIVISLKGTSLALWDGAETTTNDKENDNLFFSCCCAQQGQLTWRKVCDCASATYTCNNTCLVKSLRKENRYYQAALELYSNVTALYPDSNVWVTGHSLGGAVSSLLGMTYGLPTITYEAPGEALAAQRLGLPTPPGSNPGAPQARQFSGIYHFGHTADPIYLGTCNGATGSCTYYGYAMETACHSGYECVYDVASDKGWRQGIGTHRIHVVIEDVIKKYDTVPECVTTPECIDCALWKYFESNSSDITTSSTSTSTKTRTTRTRTATCKTPGWWGCLDETTTTSATTTGELTTTTTSSSLTPTCKTPGWFGCHDKTTTTTSTTGAFTPTSTTASPTPTPPASTTSKACETPGWFWGCKDPSATSTMSHPITSPPILPSNSATPSATKHHKCTSKQWFGLIGADPSPTSTSVSTATPLPTVHSPQRQRCCRRSWFGYCKEWEDVDGDSTQEI